MNRYSKYSEKAALNNRVFNVKVLIIGTFNQKKALEGAFSVIVKLQNSRKFVSSSSTDAVTRCGRGKMRIQSPEGMVVQIFFHPKNICNY